MIDAGQAEKKCKIRRKCRYEIRNLSLVEPSVHSNSVIALFVFEGAVKASSWTLLAVTPE